MSPAISSLVNGGKAPRRHANEHALAAASCYTALDGELIMLGACNQKQFAALCRLIGRLDLLGDPRFADVRLQDPHRAALEAILAAEMLKRSAADWEALLAREVPAARVRRLAEALEDSAADERGRIRTIDYPASPTGKVTVPVAAYRADPDGPSLDSPPPRLGEHGVDILRGAGYSEAEIAALGASGAIAL